MNETMKQCPGCGRHCDLSAPSCPRGEAYARGETPAPKEGGHMHGEHTERGGRGDKPMRGERGERGGFGRERGERGGFGREHGEDRGRCRREIPDDGSLASLLHQCMHLLHHGEARGMGQGRILTILSQTDEISQRELQEHLGIQPGSLSEILGKLESRGQIHRSRDEQDKRKATLRITDAGRQALEAVSQSEQKDPFAALSAEEQETLRLLLNKVLNTNK